MGPVRARLLYTARLLLVLAVVASTQGYLLTQAAFSLRRDYIAERLCVNRARPELECHGRCLLKERIEQQQRQERERQTVMLGLALSAVMLRPAPVDLPAAPARAVPSYAVWAAAAPPVGAPADVFHPPRVA